MAENTDILSYKLDIADVEAKARRMEELLRKIAEGKAGGKDTGAEERAYRAEYDALSRSKGKTDEAQLSLEKLLKSKRDMVDVVSLLGGRFGGLIGDLSGVVELFLALGPAAAGVAATLATITLGKQAWDAYNATLRETIDLEKKRAEWDVAQRSKKLGQQGTIDQQLLSMGAFSAANSKAAYENTQDVVAKYGLDPATSQQAATVAAAIGVSDPDQIAALAVAIAGGKGGNPQEASAVLRNPKLMAQLLKTANEFSQSETAKVNIAGIKAGDRGSPRFRAEDAVYEEWKSKGLLPENVKSIADFTAWVSDSVGSVSDPNFVRSDLRLTSSQQKRQKQSGYTPELLKLIDWLGGDDIAIDARSSEELLGALARKRIEQLERASPGFQGIGTEAAGMTREDVAARKALERIGGGNAPSADPLAATNAAGQPITINQITNIGTQMNTGSKYRDIRYSPTGLGSPGDGSRMQDQTAP